MYITNTQKNLLPTVIMLYTTNNHLKMFSLQKCKILHYQFLQINIYEVKINLTHSLEICIKRYLQGGAVQL